MKNYKTTLCGLAFAAGTSMQMSDNPTIALIGKVLMAVGGGGGLMYAKDHDKSGK